MTTPRFPEVSALVQQADDVTASSMFSSQLETKLDKEISELEEAALRLRAARNSCSPLLRLPLETLGEIAEALASIWPASIGHMTYATRPYMEHAGKRKQGLRLGWVLFGHVCRKTRKALLARRDLWAHNICSISSTPESVIPYCGSMPLHIDISVHRRNWEITGTTQQKWVDFITSRLGSSRIISIAEVKWQRDIAGGAFEQRLAAAVWRRSSILVNLDPSLFSTTSFPHLTHLSLIANSDPPRLNPDLSADILELPEMVAPALRSLHLRDYILPFNPSTLTSLTLRFDPPMHIYSHSMFLGILRRCPLLRSLGLHNCIPLLPQNVAEPVSLPSLEDASFEDDIRRCLGLLSHISTPTSTSYSVICRDAQTEFAEPSVYLDAFASLFRDKVNPESITGLKIYTCEKSTFTLYQPCEPTKLGPNDVDTHYPTPLSANHGYRKHVVCQFNHTHFASDHVRPHLALIIASLSNVIDFGTIKTLHLYPGSLYTYDTPSWTAILSRFPNLATLQLTNHYRNLIGALVAPSSPSDHGIGSAVVLPQLRWLWLDRLDFRKEEQEGFTRSGFLRILSSRQRADCPLEHLQVDIMLVKDPDHARRIYLPRLRAIVPLVEVDVQPRHPDSDIDDDSDDAD